ncbi:CREBRF-like protein [Lucilia cuprina]|uniref:CREBRF-like protein n=1 Tax=Lucilia cuprina TaxID=7375 RepID=A0A0L0C2W5_LUCCU|nr:CREBRF-like protein [Lucilia cuprina]
MTENQLFPMSTELFDTSSNSSNPLKYDLYTLGLTTSVGSATALFATFTNTSSGGGIGTNSLFTPTSSSSSSLGGGSGSSNVMLTNAITIPRSNNPNQSHNPYQDEAQHHPTNSPFLSHLLHHQQQQNLQQQQQQHINNMMSSSANMQQQQQQQQNQQHSSGLLSNSLSDYSDYTLDASISPSLLQDVSLSAAAPSQGLNSGQNSSASLTSPFYSQDPSSPLSNNNGSLGSNGATGGSNGSGNSSNLNISSSTDITGVTFLTSTATADDSSSLLYDSNLAPNSMWSDVGSAISTKHEPFFIEENYIFPLDKSDVNNTGFGDFEGDIANLEDIGNLEDFLPSSGSHDDAGHSFHLLSPSLHTAAQSSTPSPGMGPPMELLQHQQQEQQHQHITQFTQIQTMQNSNGEANGNSNQTNSMQIQQQQQQQQQNHQSSSSPYEIYHSTPNKHQLQQQQHNTNFSPGSLVSCL